MTRSFHPLSDSNAAATPVSLSSFRSGTAAEGSPLSQPDGVLEVASAADAAPSRVQRFFPLVLRILGAALRHAGTIGEMILCALVRALEWISNGSTAELCGEEALELLARERCQRKIVDALAEYVQSRRLRPGDVVILRHEVRFVRCEWCRAAFASSRDRCPRCHRPAVPAPYPPMVLHLQKAATIARWSYRRAAALRKASVMRRRARQ